MKRPDEQIGAFHFLARQIVARWANYYADPERIILHRDRVAAAMPETNRHVLVEQIRDIASALHHAFQTEDAHERDCCLTWARALNARAAVYAGQNPMPGGIPIDTDSVMERAIFHVQKHIAHTMRVCTKCGICFFQRRAKQQICGKKCRLNSKRVSNQLSWERNAKTWRPPKRAAS